MGNDPICVVQNRMEGNNVLKDLQLALRRLKMSWAAAVEHMPRNQEIVGSNPTRCWAFFFFFHLFLLECPKSQGGASLTSILCVVKEKMDA